MTEHDRLKFKVVDLGWDEATRSSSVNFTYYCPTCGMELEFDKWKKRWIYRHLKMCRRVNEPR